MLDLLFLEILWIKGLQRRTVITHAFGSVPAHFKISLSVDLAIFLVQSVIEGRLLHRLPRIRGNLFRRWHSR